MKDSPRPDLGEVEERLDSLYEKVEACVVCLGPVERGGKAVMCGRGGVAGRNICKSRVKEGNEKSGGREERGFKDNEGGWEGSGWEKGRNISLLSSSAHGGATFEIKTREVT